ncbi:hypothetical protein KFL_009740050 [Klebsormidium nitens]|uniref:Uncharacterized protein n=1 Tax=Klebsormidium nitens TaxID=105231 RepID=A0A1Y1ISR0_KLENI|nr:hypothetical protein KFL_009740050 [Klebsormidium nitens]|eukprot:GAQ92311.1 hypothetical protein KFL_009740050 [Klebsormidium nitens]
MRRRLFLQLWTLLRFCARAPSLVARSRLRGDALCSMQLPACSQLLPAGLRADAPLPALWELSSEAIDIQPLSCIDEWGQLFELSGGVYRLRSEDELAALEREGDMRDTAAAKARSLVDELVESMAQHTPSAGTELMPLQRAASPMLLPRLKVDEYSCYATGKASRFTCDHPALARTDRPPGTTYRPNLLPVGDVYFSYQEPISALVREPALGSTRGYHEGGIDLICPQR